VRGDTKNNQIMMGDHQEGFGYISNIAIDQHVLARNRQFDIYGILREKPGLLGIGIDEGTAVVVRRDTMEVIGASYVLIYDGSFWSREGSDLKILPERDHLFYTLRSGDRYNLHERKVIQ
jgi:cyanophycinase